MLQRYVAVSQETLAFLDKQERPTSVIYTQIYDSHLPEAADHSLAFRVVKDPFCKALIDAFDTRSHQNASYRRCVIQAVLAEIYSDTNRK